MRKTNCSARRHPATSSHVTGVETAGTARARTVYGVAVVLRAAFWLQSTNTLPGLRLRVIRCTTSRGSARSASTASAFAYSETRSDDAPRTPASRCSPFAPEVLAYASIPSAASRSRSHSATSQQCTTVAGGPGSRSKTSRSASSGSAAVHWWVWNSVTRFAAHIRLARSCTSTIRAGPSERGTSAVVTQSGVPGGTFLEKNT